MDKKYIHILLDKGRGNNYVSYPDIIMTAKDAFLETEKEFRRLNGLIRNKKMSDEHIGNSIFKTLRGEVTDSEIKLYAHDHFTAGYYSFLDIKERMIKENCFDEVGIKKYGYIINNIIYDLRIFANYIGQQTNPEYYLFSGGKSNIEDSRWHYLGTMQLLYNCTFDKKMLDDKFAFILSAVSLRQTIELKMQRILGVADYFDLLGQKIFTNHYFFFDFIVKHKSHFDLTSINIRVIQKVFEFCNISVHKGIMPFYWQMFYATKFCDQLFYDPDYKTRKGWNIHSAIRVTKYEDLKIKLETELVGMFPKPEYELHIAWIKPEAQLLD